MPANSQAAQRFRANVAAILESRNKSVAEMAVATGMSRPGLSRVLNGHGDVTLSRAEKIAKYLGVELANLLRPEKNKVHA